MGYTNLSFFLNIIDKIFLTRFSSVKTVSFTLNFLYLTFNIIFAILRLVFINKIFIKIFFYILVIAPAFLLIIFYTIFLAFSNYLTIF